MHQGARSTNNLFLLFILVMFVGAIWIFSFPVSNTSQPQAQTTRSPFLNPTPPTPAPTIPIPTYTCATPHNSNTTAMYKVYISSIL